jgi:2-isopropylmalate synthase
MAETVEFLDTTLRDGNKLPFVVLDRHDRLVIARQLATLGVDIIDAGYPASSEEERDIVGAIAEEVRGPGISALSRAVVEDVEEVCRLLAKNPKPHVHIFLPLSPHFLKNKLKLSAEQTLARIQRCLETAGKMPVQFSLGEIAEAEPEFLIEAAAVIASGGAGVLNLADTYGSMHPQAAAGLVHRIAATLEAKPDIRIGVHFHNDLGLATANSLACLEAGARHVECTLGGLGERGGNAALEEIVFVLEAVGSDPSHPHGSAVAHLNAALPVDRYFSASQQSCVRKMRTPGIRAGRRRRRGEITSGAPEAPAAGSHHRQIRGFPVRGSGDEPGWI